MWAGKFAPVTVTVVPGAAGLGAALDPNAVTSIELGTAVRAVLDGHSPHVARDIGEELRRAPGRDVARAALSWTS